MKAEGLKGLPEDWRLWCLRERIDLDPARVWPQFQDYWLAASGQIARKRDWLACWRGWVRRQPKRTPRDDWKAYAEQHCPARAGESMEQWESRVKAQRH